MADGLALARVVVVIAAVIFAVAAMQSVDAKGIAEVRCARAGRRILLRALEHSRRASVSPSVITDAVSSGEQPLCVFVLRYV
jgi:hypothetical protein